MFNTYKIVVELPPIELKVLNWMMAYKVEPMTIEHLRSVEADCEVSWAYQKVSEDTGYLDRTITGEFDNGMIMDVCFWGEVGQTEGYYAGIRFGDKDDIFVEAGECKENCYDIANGCEGMIDGVYAMYYDGDIYEVEIKAAE